MRLSRLLWRWRRLCIFTGSDLGIELSIPAEKRIHGATMRRHNNMAVIDLLRTNRGSQHIEG